MCNLPNEIQLGYCTNVHAGTSLDEVVQNLRNYTLPIKKAVSPTQPFGVGLWFSNDSSLELKDSSRLMEFAEQLRAMELIPFTLNGFPFGNFHQEVVKQKVYQPTWAENSRLDYTVRLAKILDKLLPSGVEGSISTLPIGWPRTPRTRFWDAADEDVVRRASLNVAKCALELDRLFQETGRKIRIAIEPEPGCLIDNYEGVIRFFADYLDQTDLVDKAILRKHVGVCHDVCHSAVMFEPQSTAIEAYSNHGIKVVKVQVSSAIEIEFDEIDRSEMERAVAELRAFHEPRYLHQVCVRGKSTENVSFYNDLDEALAAFSPPTGTWRVHFHVPIFQPGFELVATTRDEIGKAWSALRDLQPDCTHFEIETYAWNVMSDHMKADSLVESVAEEISWFRSQVIGN